jgi:hypothetical protein
VGKLPTAIKDRASCPLFPRDALTASARRCSRKAAPVGPSCGPMVSFHLPSLSLRLASKTIGA